MPVWVCCKCFKIKDLNGPHLANKSEVRSDCWPCATKRRFRLVESSEALRNELEGETPKAPAVPPLDLKKAESMPKSTTAPTGFGFSNSPRDNDPKQFQKILGTSTTSETKPEEKKDVAPAASVPSTTTAAAGPGQLEWRCAKCNKVKDLSGDHLKGKTTVRSDCWPCATKRQFLLLPKGQAGAPTQPTSDAPKPNTSKEKPVQAPVSSSTPAATETKPVFGASTENPFSKLVQKEEAKPTANPFTKILEKEEAKPSSNPFTKILEKEEAKPKANPFSLGSSTPAQASANPFTKTLQAEETKPKPNPFSLKAEPASAPTLAKTQEQPKAPEAKKVEPKVDSPKKAEIPRPNHCDSSEPWRKASPTLNCDLEPLEMFVPTLPPDFDPFASGKGEKYAPDNIHFISTELAKCEREAPRVEPTAVEAKPQLPQTARENHALAAEIKALRDEDKTQKEKIRSLEKKIQRMQVRMELEEQRGEKRFEKHLTAVQETETNLHGVIDQVERLVKLVRKLSTR